MLDVITKGLEDSSVGYGELILRLELQSFFF